MLSSGTWAIWVVPASAGCPAARARARPAKVEVSLFMMVPFKKTMASRPFHDDRLRDHIAAAGADDARGHHVMQLRLVLVVLAVGAAALAVGLGGVGIRPRRGRQAMVGRIEGAGEVAQPVDHILDPVAGGVGRQDDRPRPEGRGAGGPGRRKG